MIIYVIVADGTFARFNGRVYHWFFSLLYLSRDHSDGGFRLSLFGSFSFLNSSFPNFHVKLTPIDLKGTLRTLVVTKPGPNKLTSWLMYLLKILFAVSAMLAFLFHNCFLTAMQYDVNEG